MNQKISLDTIKKLREETKAGVLDCRCALEECGSDMQKAKDWLKKKGMCSADKRADREAKSGIVETYTHLDGKIASMVELNCETDFVARTDEFKKLAHEIAMQVAAMSPKDGKDLRAQKYIRDESMTIDDLVKEAIGKLGENIVIRQFSRCEVGK